MRLLLAAIVALPAFPAAAAPPAHPLAARSTAAVVRPSEAEALAFLHAYSPSELRRTAELYLLDKDFIAGLRKSEDTATLLDAFPDLGPALKNAMASQVDLYIEEFDAQFFPRGAAIIRESLSRDDVKALTDFYTSPLGRKMLTLSTQNVDGSEIMNLAIEDKPIDDGVTRRQAMRAGIRTYAQLSEPERAQMRQFIQSPPARHFHAIQPKLVSLQTELMNDPGPRFKAASEKAMAEAFQRITGIDPAK